MIRSRTELHLDKPPWAAFLLTLQLLLRIVQCDK